MSEEPLIKMTTKVGKQGKVSIPAAIRRKIDLKEGQELEIRLLKLGDNWMIVLQEVKSNE